MLYTKNYYTEQEAKQFIAQCDQEFDNKIEGAVQYILNKKARFLCLCGPSCAGKTTTAQRITSKLAKKGVTTHVISIDDFFYDMEYLVAMSQAKGRALDMDSADAIDLATFKTCLQELIDTCATNLPVFDFHTHKRSSYRAFSCDSRDLIIFEGIQAIYPQITDLIKPHGMASIFVCPDQPITVGEQVFDPNIYRFYRRIVRDAQYRSATATRTLEIWRGVRNNEDANIFPYRDSCEYVVDTSMAYDLHLLTPYLRELMPTVEEQSRFYLRALDILNRISDIHPISVNYLSANSLYREFIKF